jgi:proton glutamate symport protein
LAVDRVLDMGRTAVNVWSDSCGAAVIDALEG